MTLASLIAIGQKIARHAREAKNRPEGSPFAIVTRGSDDWIVVTGIVKRQKEKPDG